jgi:hypothetical protein
MTHYTSLVTQKFPNKKSKPRGVIAAKAAIQIYLNFLDSGSRFLAKAGITPACPE